MPVSMNNRAMPAPGPVPTSFPNTGARRPPGIMAGSKICSANGPAMRVPTGIMARESVMRADITRPWTSGATLDNQTGARQPLRMGMKKKTKKVLIVIKEFKDVVKNLWKN